MLGQILTAALFQSGVARQPARLIGKASQLPKLVGYQFSMRAEEASSLLDHPAIFICRPRAAAARIPPAGGKSPWGVIYGIPPKGDIGH